jgi:predicted nucleic acid-binding protein
MSGAEVFFDSNVLLYLLSSDAGKAERVETLLQRRGVISTQVLNEVSAVVLRKQALSFPELHELLANLREFLGVVPLTVEVHERGLEVAERWEYSLYDSMIIAAALESGCRTLYSEDLQHRQMIDRRLQVINPFETS